MPTLSESDSKSFLARHGVSFLPEQVVQTAPEAAVAGEEMGFPVVVKLCGDGIAHKTERGMVLLGLRDATSLGAAATSLLARATPEDGEVGILVAPMVRGIRELIAGVVRDPQFGACVMVGIGGVLAEALSDAVFRLVPLSSVDAHEMIADLKSQALLGPLRGEPEVDRDCLADLLVALGRAIEADPMIVSIDLNPLIVAEGKPIPVDALVEVA